MGVKCGAQREGDVPWFPSIYVYRPGGPKVGGECYRLDAVLLILCHAVENAHALPVEIPESLVCGRSHRPELKVLLRLQ